MPGPYLYPGVYIEEIPSGVRPIAGASVSDTAFVDWFPRGAIDHAVRITTLTDFEREFGGLDAASEASYAIAQYYLNGGRVAWVVRVAAPDADTAARVLAGTQTYPGMSGAGAAASGAGASGAILTVSAVSPGAWGNGLQVAIDYAGVPCRRGRRPGSTSSFARWSPPAPGGWWQSSETYRNLSVDALSSRYVETVVNRDSRLVRVDYTGGGALPAPTGADVVGDAAGALVDPRAGRLPGGRRRAARPRRVGLGHLHRRRRRGRPRAPTTGRRPPAPRHCSGPRARTPRSTAACTNSSASRRPSSICCASRLRPTSAREASRRCGPRRPPSARTVARSSWSTSPTRWTPSMRWSPG